MVNRITVTWIFLCFVNREAENFETSIICEFYSRDRDLVNLVPHTLYEFSCISMVREISKS